MPIKGFFKKDGKTRPITERKSVSNYHGQTSDPSWKESSIKDLKDDNEEEMDEENIGKYKKFRKTSGGRILERNSFGREADILIKIGKLKRDDKEAYISKRQREVDENWKSVSSLGFGE